MTKEEAIETLMIVDENASCDDCLYYAQMEDCPDDEDCVIRQALYMAIKSLKAIDEIKAEIENLPTGVELTDGSIREFAFKNYKKGLLKIIDEKVKENKK